MADTTISIGLSPEEVVAALRKMGDETRALQKTMEDALAKKGSQHIGDLKDNAEKGANAITKFFSNMGQRIREDLKSAFDVSSVLAGARFAKEIGEGVKQVFDMEKAFDRLNVRMGLSVRQMEDFKRSAGRAVAETGLNIKDVQPGLMAAASRGNVKDPAQMTMIAQSLAQAKQINPELDTGTVTEDIAEILKRTGQQMTGATFKATMDAINSATVNGGFKSSNEAAANITQIAPYAQQLGIDTRTMAGLAAVSSKAGDAGEGVLRQLLQQGTGLDQGARLNSLFGSQVFNNGKLDPRALANVNTNQFGNISAQVLEQTTGITGASGADLKMFIDTWKTNMGSFDSVIKGSNETADQFDVATNNFASSLDKFKARVTNAGRELGDSLMEMVNGLWSGNPNHRGAAHLADTLSNSGGDLAMAGGLTLGAGLLMGGGIRGLIGGAAADASGVQKVYVTNANEIKGEGITDKVLGWGKGLAANAAILGGTAVGEIGALGAGAVGAAAVGVAGAGYAGYKIGQGINNLTGNQGGIGDWAYQRLHPDEFDGNGNLKKDIVDAIIEGQKQAKAGLPTLNPSAVKGRGASAFGGY